ncbi:MAG: hypothetical protein L6R39_005050 [Caloplaca ligustica]|nr:MAG: hypothetical protein L6R39_005050 [Caloplaca ligustica]
MAEPFSAIGTAIKLAEFCLRFREVGSESRVFLGLIARVRKDLNEALRERGEKADVLKSIPSKRAWIDGVILDAQQELNNIGRLVEDARVDGQQGKPVSFKHRFDWVWTNHQKFVTEERALATCHQSLLSAMAVMHNLTAPSEATPNAVPLFPPTYQASTNHRFDPLSDETLLRSPFCRRPGRAVLESAQNSQQLHLCDLRACSTPSLPDLASVMDDSWTESLLRLSLDGHDCQSGLLPMRSYNFSSSLQRASQDTISVSPSKTGSVSCKMKRHCSDQSMDFKIVNTPSSLDTSHGGDASVNTLPQELPALSYNSRDVLLVDTGARATTSIMEEAGDRAVLRERRRRARSRYGHE